jgi:hypothetical protein
VKVSVPRKAVFGNVLFAQVTVAGPGNPGTVMVPTGWTLISPASESVTSQVYQWLYWHKYASGDPTSWTWKFSNHSLTYYPGAAIAAVSGASSPVDAAGGQTGSSTTMIAPSVTANNSNDLLLVWEFDQNGWDTLSNPVNLTITANSGGTVDGDTRLSSSGPIGTRTNSGATGYWAAAEIAVH